MPRPDRGEADRRLSPSAQILERPTPPMIPPSADDSPTPPPRPHPRRRLRVSLRGLMVLVVLIGGAAGWVANTIRTQRQSIAAVRAAGGDVRFDWEKQQVGVSRGRPVYRREPAAPAWLRRWLGDELFQSVLSIVFPDPVPPDALATVARFDRLERVILGDLTGVGDGLRHLRGLGQLNHVWLAGPGTTDAMLTDLAEIPSIRQLTVGSIMNRAKIPAPDLKSTATDTGFGQLSVLRRLEFLGIRDCPNLSDAGVASLLTKLPPLQGFRLDGGPNSLAATLPALARHHPALESLGLDRTGVTDDDLKAVEALPKLRGINLQSTKVTDAGVAHFRSLKNLVELLINSTDLADEGLKILGELPTLEVLHFNKTKVTDAGIASLAKLPRLRQLSMGWNTITDAAMPSVARITSLERIDLYRLPGFTDAGLVPLRSLRKLKQLTAVETQVTPEGIAALQQAVPTLTRVTTKPARAVTPPATPSK